MIRYCALASGSNGNSYFIAKDDTAILVDAGINCKQLQLRMQEREIDPSSIRAVFITHEHVDHVKGLSVFVKRHKIPVYLTSGTYTALRTELPADLLNFIPVNAHIQLGALSIFGVPKYHDASEPCSFYFRWAAEYCGIDRYRQDLRKRKKDHCPIRRLIFRGQL